MFDKPKNQRRSIKQGAVAVYVAARNLRTPWFAKALALFVAGYALSPIHLSPDFVPALCYLDDLIILPLAIMIVVKMIPPEIMTEHRVQLFWR